jgi:arylsulfatase A-like enzyme
MTLERSAARTRRLTMAGQSLTTLGAGLLLLLLGCGASEDGSSPDSTGARPNVVLLSIDTLRPDHLGAWGYSRDTSPFLDELARRGTRFANAWAPSPWTLPSHATMLTGLFPHRHGAERSELTIDLAAARLPEMLLADGYGTCGVVTSIFVSDKYDFGRGFEHFHDFGIQDGTRATPDAPEAEEVFDHALEWAAGQPDDRPLFLFLHVYDVHYPCDAPSPWDEKYDRPSRPDELEYENYFYYLRNPLTPEQLEHQRNQYDEEIAYVDAMFERFVERWKAERPQTIFMVVSDHGEELGERGSWGHAHTLTPEQLHVPWIVSGLGIRDQVVEQRVGLEDLAATIAGLTGAPFATGEGLDRSSQLRDGAEVGTDAVAARFASTHRFRTIRHRWHEPPYDLIADLGRVQYQLYDLENDPGGLEDLLTGDRAADRMQAARMNREMYEWLGQPWEVVRAGRLVTEGVFVVNGQRQNQEIEAAAGLRFAMFPLDAEVTFVTVDSEQYGPYSVAGSLPGEAERLQPDDTEPPLRWHGEPLDSGDAELTEEQRERLRALGYLD